MKIQTTEQQELADQKFEIYRALHEKELDVNYAIFRAKHLDELYEKHQGKFALMKNGILLEIFDNRDDAVTEGNKRFEDRIFTAHKITKEVFCVPSVSIELKSELWD